MRPSAAGADAGALPDAEADLHRFFTAWLDQFAGFVRDVDYAAARPLFHPAVLAFGTHNDVIAGLDAWVATQWHQVWPKTTGFHFTLPHVRVLVPAGGDMAVVVAPWTSTGYHKDGAPFDRPGRATLVFNRTAEGWLCTHSHMSLNRGVPQESFADRPVKAW